MAVAIPAAIAWALPTARVPKLITQFELLPQPPKDRTPFMPWPTYPMIMKTTSSHEEGCERQWAMATKEFIGDENGNLKALKIVQLEWKLTDDGRPAQFCGSSGFRTGDSLRAGFTGYGICVIRSRKDL